MRRMYGDMESNSVYREMRSSMSSSLFEEEDHSHDEVVTSPFGSGFMPDIFSSLEYNIRVGSGLATVQSAKEPVSSRDNFQKSISAFNYGPNSLKLKFSILILYQLRGVFEAKKSS